MNEIRLASVVLHDRTRLSCKQLEQRSSEPGHPLRNRFGSHMYTAMAGPLDDHDSSQGSACLCHAPRRPCEDMYCVTHQVNRFVTEDGRPHARDLMLLPRYHDPSTWGRLQSPFNEGLATLDCWRACSETQTTAAPHGKVSRMPGM